MSALLIARVRASDFLTESDTTVPSVCPALSAHQAALAGGGSSHLLGASPCLVGRLSDAATLSPPKWPSVSLYASRHDNLPCAHEGNEAFLRDSLPQLVAWARPERVVVFDPLNVGWNVMRSLRSALPSARLEAVFIEPGRLISHNDGLSADQLAIRRSLFQDAIAQFDHIAASPLAKPGVQHMFGGFMATGVSDWSGQWS